MRTFVVPVNESRERSVCQFFFLILIDLVEFIRIWQDALNSCAGIFLHCHSALNLNCFLLPLSLLSPESFWDSNAFETDTDLPSGWMRVRDTSGTYYWHIPTGTTQWEPPSPLGKVGSSMMSSSMSLETTPCEEPEVRFATLVRWDRRARRHLPALFNFPGIMGSTLWHRWRHQRRGTVEGECWGKQLRLLRMKMSVMLQF